MIFFNIQIISSTNVFLFVIDVSILSLNCQVCKLVSGLFLHAAHLRCLHIAHVRDFPQSNRCLKREENGWKILRRGFSQFAEGAIQKGQWSFSVWIKVQVGNNPSHFLGHSLLALCPQTYKSKSLCYFMTSVTALSSWSPGPLCGKPGGSAFPPLPQRSVDAALTAPVSHTSSLAWWLRT